MTGERHAQKLDGSVSENKIVTDKNFQIMKQPELGKRIIELRKSKGMTQEELVDKCNISVRTIQRIESGEVTPRSYTVKTILEALEYEIEDISIGGEGAADKASNWLKNQMLLNVDLNGSSPVLNQQLNLAWIFGIIYFVLGFFESAADVERFKDDYLIYSEPVYISIKVVSLVAFLFFQRGFVLMGGLYKNYLLKISAIIIMFAVLFTTMLDIGSLYSHDMQSESVLGAMGITFGILGFIFGISIIRLRKPLGELALVTGVLQIIAGFFFLTLIFAFVGLILLIPVELFQIILIFKSIEQLKSSKQTEKASTSTESGYVI